MMDFDLLDDAEEILQPLCLCFNQDYSRVGVGHHNGYIIYCIHRHTNTTTNIDAHLNPGIGERNTPTARPPFYTTVESVFPPPCTTTRSSPVMWEVAVASREENTVGEVLKTEEGDTPLTEFILDTISGTLLGFMTDAFREEQKNMDEETEEEGIENQEKAAEETNQVKEACGSDMKRDKNENVEHHPGSEISGVFSLTPLSENSTRAANVYPAEREQPKGLDEKAVEYSVPAPRESGVGVMALLYKTHFVAVVGGGPYPAGPRNVVKLFVLGSVWADRTVRVPDIVQGLHLDHRLMIILTTTQLRLHSFETGQCVFALPVRNDTIPASGGPPPSGLSMLGSSGSLPSGVSWQNNSSTRMHESGLGIASVEDVATAVSTAALRHSVPLAVDYNNKYLVFRSSLRGFSLVRYDTDSSLGSRIRSEVLATVPVAHEHTIASLAMYVGNEMANSSENKSGNKDSPIFYSASPNSAAASATHVYRNTLVATSSEHATIIRIWRYVEKPDGPASSGIADTEANLAASKNNNCNSNDESNLPGSFVKIKEVRNASIPTPVFQMQFLGEKFLFCIAWNTIKVFYIGEVAEPKPYDVSIRDQSKCMRAQNVHSSLHRLGMVSEYFKSEWAACECPLPLVDETFLPKWVRAATMELRQHLMRGINSCRKIHDSTRQASDVEAVNTGSILRDGVVLQDSLQDALSSASSPTIAASTGGTTPQYWGGFVRQCLSLYMTPVMGGATRVAKRYWSSGGGEVNAFVTDPFAASGGKQEDSVSERKRCDWDTQRDYSTMTEVAQAVVVWWEKPAYRDLEYMTSAALRNRDGRHDALLPPVGISETMTLYCVTCDGCAISFEFDPMEGSITCSEAVPVATTKQ